MEPIYNHLGRTIAWLKNNTIYDTIPRPRAFIRQRVIYTYEGRYIGQFEHGFFRDKQGHAVAFMQGASGGPIPPVTEVSPVPPIPPIPPIEPILSIPPIPPIPSLSWSSLEWEDFLRG
jgi:hypothetical protein